MSLPTRPTFMIPDICKGCAISVPNELATVCDLDPIYNGKE